MTPRQQRAIQALLECPTRRAAAEKAGISESTLRSYFQNPEFVSAYQQAAREALEHATRRAEAAAGEAVDVLRSIMSDDNELAGPRVSAADKVLGYALKLTEQNDILSRLDKLEQQAEQDND